jgi:1-acyl-sn-glycerol-3-phosphate acyltransferase
MRKHLSEDRCIYIIFPEGTRTKTGELGEFKAGLGMLVAGTEVPVIPCWLDGCYEACPRNSKMTRPVSITVHIGPPLTFEDLTPSRDGWEAVAQRAQAAVAALAPDKQI